MKLWKYYYRPAKELRTPKKKWQFYGPPEKVQKVKEILQIERWSKIANRILDKIWNLKEENWNVIFAGRDYDVMYEGEFDNCYFVGITKINKRTTYIYLEVNNEK